MLNSKHARPEPSCGEKKLEMEYGISRDGIKNERGGSSFLLFPNLATIGSLA